MLCVQGFRDLEAPIYGTTCQFWLRLCDHELMEYERKAQMHSYPKKHENHTIAISKVVLTVCGGKSARCTSLQS